MGRRGRQRQTELYRGSSTTVPLLRETMAWGEKGVGLTLLMCQGLKRISVLSGVEWVACSQQAVSPFALSRIRFSTLISHTQCIFFSFFHSAAAAYLFQRQLSPTPGYPSQYQLYAMENTRQTILNDYITSQQMQVNLRPDVTRGLSPREQPLGLPYPATRGV